MKKKILKGISLLLAFLIVLSTVACGGNPTTNDATESTDGSINISTNEIKKKTDSKKNSYRVRYKQRNRRGQW